MVTLYQAGELKLRELVTRTYHLDGINDALAALAAGEGARGIHPLVTTLTGVKAVKQ